NFIVPLPPLSEQKRIVSKVTELLSLCDTLEAKLTQAESASTQLLSAAVHHLLNPAQNYWPNLIGHKAMGWDAVVTQMDAAGHSTKVAETYFPQIRPDDGDKAATSKCSKESE
ncbi:MAG: hypothetical protein ABL921_24500, partial [Pirellula sp.]